MPDMPRTALDETDLEWVSGGATLHGSAGDDNLSPQAGPDEPVTIIGGDGNDLIFSSAGDDYILGGAGNDTIDAGMLFSDDDFLIGGPGNDVLVWSIESGDDTFEGGSGHDTIRVHIPEGALNEYLRGMSVDGAMHLVRHMDGDLVTFTDRDGNPVSISGTFTCEGSVLHFSGVDAIRFATSATPL